MPDKVVGRFTVRPYHLHESHKYSCNDVEQDEMAQFFKDLSKFIRKNPDMHLENMSMSYQGTENMYYIELQWVDNGVV